MSTTLYRYFDSEGHLLYVGISGNNLKRQSQHKKNAAWFGLVSTATFEHYESRTEALAAEKLAIQRENPAHNIQHAKTPLQEFDMTEALAKLHFMTIFSAKDIYGNAVTIDQDHKPIHDRFSKVQLFNEEYGWSYDECLAWELYVAQIDFQRGKIDLPSYDTCQECRALLESDWYFSCIESATEKIKVAREEATACH